MKFLARFTLNIVAITATLIGLADRPNARASAWRRMSSLERRRGLQVATMHASVVHRPGRHLLPIVHKCVAAVAVRFVVTSAIGQ